MSEPDGGSPPSSTSTMAPRRHEASPRGPRRGGPYRTRPRRRRAPIGAGERRELVRNRLIESRLTPNAISLTGLALNLVAAVLVWEELFFLGGVAFIVGSIMDTLDGRYSRMSGKGTPFGAFLDSTLDRIEEGIVLTAVAGYFALQGDRVAAAAVVVAVLASLMVSYTRARAEALGVECKVGIATRPVRVVILSIGLIFAGGHASLVDHVQLLAPAVYVLAALSLITVAQRVAHVRRELSALESTSV
jgi:CDP-diacylglycerol--glycerol-3-phosphate 3-phosphatidyltransferase